LMAIRVFHREGIAAEVHRHLADTVPICSTAIEETNRASQDASVTFSRCRTAAWPSAVAPPWLPMAGMIAAGPRLPQPRAHRAHDDLQFGRSAAATPTATRSPGGLPLAGNSASKLAWTASATSAIAWRLKSCARGETPELKSDSDEAGYHGGHLLSNAGRDNRQIALKFINRCRCLLRDVEFRSDKHEPEKPTWSCSKA